MKPSKDDAPRCVFLVIERNKEVQLLIGLIACLDAITTQIIHVTKRTHLMLFSIFKFSRTAILNAI